MDSLTHIYFAHKLLIITGGDPTAAVCSLFPQIDREPAYYHRMYAHPFSQISKLAEIGRYVYKFGEIQEGYDNSYAWKRFLSDRARMRSFAQDFEEENQLHWSNFDPDRMSILIAYVSHTYQDIFNNPMQAFLPQWTYPSGQWELWSSLGSMDFRTILYSPKNIAAFREEFFRDRLWAVNLDGASLIKAMINRTALASALPIPPFLTDTTFAVLEINSPVSESTVKMAEEFLIEHEQLLSNMMRKYSRTYMSQPNQSTLPINS